jgi:hypothetical protein
VSRTELALPSAVRIDELAVHAAAVGLRLSVKMYPRGSPVRDAGHLRLLARFKSRVDPALRWRSEVPIGDNGDLRAWDAQLDGAGSIAIDAETRLQDMQALQRRCETKLRDSGVDRLVLVVGATRHNRRVLGLHRDALRSTFPADTAEVMRALEHGRVSSTNGIVVV